jgi:hypothetical protein
MDTIDVSQPDGFQLAFIQLGFQAVTVGLNLMLLIMRELLSGIFTSVVQLFTGTT